MGQKGKGKGSVVAEAGKSLRVFFYPLVGVERESFYSGEPNTPEGRANAGKLLEEINQGVAAEREFRKTAVAIGLPNPALGPVTLRRFIPFVLSQRKTFIDNLRNEEMWINHYILTSFLADLPVKETRTHHIRQWVEELKAVTMYRMTQPLKRPEESKRTEASRKTLSAKSVRNIYGVLRVIFTHAIEAKIIQANDHPCIGLGLGLSRKRSVLPANRPADPNVARKVGFERHEAIQLISNQELPADNRMIYTFMLLTGTRHGEAAGLKWIDIDREAPHLPCATIWDEKMEQHRFLPMHPTLQAAMAEWELSGWQELYGRKPEPGDLVFPTGVPVPGKGRRRPAGELRGDSYTRKRLHKDLARLGMRQRRVHCMRHTFISLTRSDGASRDIIVWMTHKPPAKDAFDLYTKVEWQALCRELQKYDLKRNDSPTSNLLPMKKVET